MRPANQCNICVIKVSVTSRWVLCGWAGGWEDREVGLGYQGVAGGAVEQGSRLRELQQESGLAPEDVVAGCGGTGDVSTGLLMSSQCTGVYGLSLSARNAQIGTVRVAEKRDVQMWDRLPGLGFWVIDTLNPFMVFWV